MYATCTHTLKSGAICQSPALRGTELCHHHTPHQVVRRKRPGQHESFDLPPLHSKNSILLAMDEVLDRLAKRRIKISEAETLIRGLKAASRLMTDMSEEGESPECRGVFLGR